MESHVGWLCVTPFIRKVEGPLDSSIQPVKFHKTTLVDEALADLLPIVLPQRTLEHQLSEIRSMGKMSGRSQVIKDVFS